MEITNKITKGLLHCHTEHSLKDSPLNPNKLVEVAASLGAPAITLTDHGTMSAVDKFGVEGYIKENKTDSRLHIVLLAKDKIGEVQIGKYVSETNKYVEEVGKSRFPIGNKELLTKYFGYGSAGYGHIIATSACIGGIIGGLNYQNENNKAQIEKLIKITKIQEETTDLLERNYQIINDLATQKDHLEKIANKKYGMIERQLKKTQSSQPDAYAKGMQQLEAEKQATELAKAKIKEIKANINAIQKKNTELKKKLTLTPEAYQHMSADIDKMKEKIYTENQLVEKMKEQAYIFDNLFGHGNFFIEIQNHGIAEELKYMHHLVYIAESLDIPYVAANDVHMAKPEDFEAMEMIRAMRFNKYEPLPKEDRELYIKTDEELYKAIAHAIGPQKAMVAMENVGLVMDMCEELPENGEHYPVFDKTQDANELLKKLAYDGISKRFAPEEWTQEYQERLEHELSIITSMGYADYHLIDQDFINFAKKLGYMPESRLKYLEQNMKDMTLEEMINFVEADQSNVGYVVGPGRGSAAGSLVCYNIGITNIDPLKYNLLFERFLNPERVTMPDIDTDFANGYREIAIEYVCKKYGSNATCRILTLGTYAARGSLRAVARVLAGAYQDKEELYNELGDKLAKLVPMKPNETISNNLDSMKELRDTYPEADEIVRKALGIEGTVVQNGIHAAGVIIADNNDVSEYVPLSVDKATGNWVCQCDMVEAEGRGLLKMDFLGLKNLNIITDTLRLILKNTGRKINPDTDILEEAAVVKEICGLGKTNSIFQLESGGMKSMLKEFKPDSFEDIILLVAAYRPGPMDYIPQMIEVKHGKRPAEYPTPELKDILAPTYSCIIYQEQVQQIFQKLAGYSLGQADLVRRAMSKKKEKVIQAERQSFIYGDPNRNIPGCVNNGISEEIANNLFDRMAEFAKYAFNKSHAAAYARVTYITAWLKYYYPTEYLCVAMEYAATNKIQGLIEECKSYDINVLPVDINESKASFDTCGKDIRFGITSIKGIGNIDYSIEKRNIEKYISLSDYILRGQIDKSVTEGLIDAGAFDKICENRVALKAAAEEMQDYLKIIKDTNKKLLISEAVLDELKTDKPDNEKLEYLKNNLGLKNKKLPDKAKVIDDINRYKTKIAEATEELKEVAIPVEMDEDYEARLNREKELLGAYITGHPLDAYEVTGNFQSIDTLSESKFSSIRGIIRNLKIIHRKKDGAEMAIFEVEDKTDTIKVVCFAQDYVSYKDILRENAVIVVGGSVKENNQEKVTLDENNNEVIEVVPELEMFCKSCIPARKKIKDIVMQINNIVDWNEKVLPLVKQYVSKNGGYRLVLFDSLFGEYRTTNIIVHPTIKNNYAFNFM